MSDPKALAEELQRSIERAKAEAVAKSLADLVPPESQWRESPTPAKKAKAPRPMVTWKTRDSFGKVIPARQRSTINPSHRAGPSQMAHPGGSSQTPDTSFEDSFTRDDVERFIEELQQSLSNVSGDMEADPTPARLLASCDWSTRNRALLESWLAERPLLINSTAAKADVGTHMCQQCATDVAVVCCRGCEPRPFLCSECDVAMHKDTRYVLHNRDALIGGFFQPLPPTTCIVEKAHCRCDRLVPLRMPDSICTCPKEALKVNPGKSVAVITMDGRYDLSLPELSCELCKATWTAGVDDLIRRNYWPATPLQFAAVYDSDIFFSFEKMKMASPGLSCQAFLRMLDHRTVHFGRTGKISTDTFLKSYFQWQVAQFAIQNICKEQPFTCPACTPDMVSISVDGNRKLYRFKSASRSEEQPLFEGLFIARDEDVASFVDYIHQTTDHVSGRGVCGGQWSAAKEVAKKHTSNVDESGIVHAVCRHGITLSALNMKGGEIYAYPLYLQKQLATKPIQFFCTDVACKYYPYLEKVAGKCPELQNLLSMKPLLSVFHAKAHDFKCEVNLSGSHLEGAGLTLGEEVEMTNAFLSRIGVTTKHMTKAGRTDMLSLMAMQWNQHKIDNLTTSLSRRYQKTVKDLQRQQQKLESLKVELAVTESQLEDWVKDVQEWAKATTTTDEQPDALAHKIETLVLGIKRRSQRINKEADSCKARARFLSKIRKEKELLTSVLEVYNKAVPSSDALNIETILSVDTAWPWQLQHCDSVDLRTKRRGFDAIMAVRRLHEEKKILVSEMEKHWKCLSARAHGLTELVCSVSTGTLRNSPWDLSEQGLKGLTCILRRKQWEMKEVMKQSRLRYVQVLRGAENITFMDTDAEEDEDYYDSDSDSDHME